MISFHSPALSLRGAGKTQIRSTFLRTRFLRAIPIPATLPPLNHAPRRKRQSLHNLVFLLLASLVCGIAAHAHAEEIPVETCDVLPVVQVSVSGMKFFFLVDTAATSMLNLKSFAHGDTRRIAVTSWSGTVETRAQEITLGDLTIGQHHFQNLKLPAVDLSGIGQACGRILDGILGIDLLGRLHATLDLKDLKNRTARLVMGAENTQSRASELHAQLAGCEQAFNRADEIAFADCFDPQVVIFTIAGDYYGRDAAMDYYRSRYFEQRPRAQLSITSRASHALGEAMWVEYDLRITMGERAITARGTALCQKEDGRWRIVHMNHSTPPTASTQAEYPQDDGGSFLGRDHPFMDTTRASGAPGPEPH